MWFSQLAVPEWVLSWFVSFSSWLGWLVWSLGVPHLVFIGWVLSLLGGLSFWCHLSFLLFLLFHLTGTFQFFSLLWRLRWDEWLIHFSLFLSFSFLFLLFHLGVLWLASRLISINSLFPWESGILFASMDLAVGILCIKSIGWRPISVYAVSSFVILLKREVWFLKAVLPVFIAIEGYAHWSPPNLPAGISPYPA